MSMTDRQLVLGVDGGGSKTACRIATIAADGRIDTLGEGFGGPSNVRAVGQAHAKINLDVAVDAAHRDADTTETTVAYAVLALAGSSLPDVKLCINKWAQARNLARQVDVVHDADPVLAVGAPNGHGIALIVGTGSVAMGMHSDGSRSVVGGWGHWFGDAGSGFDLGRRALVAVADAVDEEGPDTSLIALVLKHLDTDNAREILQIMDQTGDIRREIASLAPILLHAAEEGDEVALGIVASATEATASLVRAAAKKVDLADAVSLAVAGGIVCSSSLYREILLDTLARLGVKLATVSVVREPVEGSLIMARNRLYQSRGIE
jgi:N-acetylglucosamine kinase-like BadF-type ATPase